MYVCLTAWSGLVSCSPFLTAQLSQALFTSCRGAAAGPGQQPPHVLHVNTWSDLLRSWLYTARIWAYLRQSVLVIACAVGTRVQLIAYSPSARARWRTSSPYYTPAGRKDHTPARRRCNCREQMQIDTYGSTCESVNSNTGNSTVRVEVETTSVLIRTSYPKLLVPHIFTLDVLLRQNCKNQTNAN